MASHWVILVDGDGLRAEALQQALDAEGYRTLWVRDGAEALDLMGLLKTRPASLVLQLMTPVMDGLEFLRLSRGGALSPPPIVAIAASPWLLEQALDLGAAATVALGTDLVFDGVLDCLWELNSGKGPRPLARSAGTANMDHLQTLVECVPSERLISQFGALLGLDLALLKELSGEWVCLASTHADLAHRRGPVRGSIWGESLHSRQDYWFSDLARLPVLAASHEHRRLGFRALAAVPCRTAAGSAPILLAAMAMHPRVFSHLDAAILDLAARAIFRDASDPESLGLNASELTELARLVSYKQGGPFDLQGFAPLTDTGIAA